MLDHAHCFPSFDGEKVLDLLPVPKRVTKSVILNGSHNLVYHSYWRDLFGIAKPEAHQVLYAEEHAGAQRGFPQGSAVSSLAVDMLLTPLYAQLPVAGVSVGYADNFLALGKCKTEAVTMTEAFGAALKAHPAGHFVPNLPKTFGPEQPIDFLGHRLQMCIGSVHIAPTPENIQKFWDHVNFDLFRICAASNKKNVSWIAAEARGFVRSWSSSFRVCTEINNYRVKALHLIASALT